MPEVYEELRRLAAAYLRGERAEQTLQPTALVHEAYLNLLAQSRVHWDNPAHFVGIFARAHAADVEESRRRKDLREARRR